MPDYHLGCLNEHYLSGRVEFDTKNTYTLTRYWIPRENNPSLLDRVHEAHKYGLEAARAVLDKASVGAARDRRKGLSWRGLEKEIASDCENTGAPCEDVLVRLKFELDAERYKRWPDDLTPGA